MTTIQAKPFLKWAGGKTQLIKEIESVLPTFTSNQSFTYIEPFVGGGAILFWILAKFPNIKNAVINDINTDLTNCYQTIKDDVNTLIDLLKKWETDYHSLGEDHEQKKVIYYEKRKLFNDRTSNRTTQSALFIFLNRTCFNGLYRVNQKNEFNVPIGRYKKPQICNKTNLLAVSKVLQKVTILNGDYSETKNHTANPTLFYFDPPYKPLSDTSSFNAYAKGAFDDTEQIRLKDFCASLHQLNNQWILSNSDVKNTDIKNDFFDVLYQDFTITRVLARRNINAKGSRRGLLTELLIHN